jgi:hypothetical protein
VRDRDASRSLVVTGVRIALVALAIRFAMSLVQNGGTYDIFDAYRVVGNQLRLGGDIYTGASDGPDRKPAALCLHRSGAILGM